MPYEKPLLRSAVRSTWLAYNKPKEGRYGCMYLDSKRIVTTAVGYRLATADEAARLPWTDKDSGVAASPGDVRLEYAKVAAMTSLAKDGANAAMKATRLRLSEATIDRLTFERLDAMVKHLVEQFPAFASFPADVQRVLCSISWAAGSTIIPVPGAKGWPRLTGHLQREDFAAAADEVKLDESLTLGVVARNVANKAGMLAGAAVVERGADPALLYERPEAVPAGVLVRELRQVRQVDEVPGAREAQASAVLLTRETVSEQARADRDARDRGE